MIVDLNVEQLRKDTEYAFEVIAKTYRLKGERNGLGMAGVPEKKLAADYDETLVKMEKECELAVDAVYRQLDGEEF